MLEKEKQARFNPLHNLDICTSFYYMFYVPCLGTARSGKRTSVRGSNSSPSSLMKYLRVNLASWLCKSPYTFPQISWMSCTEVYIISVKMLIRSKTKRKRALGFMYRNIRIFILSQKFTELLTHLHHR